MTTFNFTVAQWLARHGHEVHAHIVFRESTMDVVETQIARHFPTTVGTHLPDVAYDVALVSDGKSLAACGPWRAPVLAFAHGLGPLAHEYQPEGLRDVRHVVALSPFMTRYYAARLPGHRVSFLPNVIDVARFSSQKPLREAARTALLADRRRAPEYLERIRPVFQERGVELVPVAELAFGMPIWDMHAYYGYFDLVLGCGRSAYEAMACGRNVVVLGVNGGDGFVDRASFAAAFDRNCSGYGIRKLRWDDPHFASQLGAEIDKYSARAGNDTRALAVEHVDSDHFMPGFLDACAAL